MTQHLAPCPLSSPPAGRKVETRQGETSFAPPHVSITLSSAASGATVQQWVGITLTLEPITGEGVGWPSVAPATLSCNPFAPRVEGNPKGLCAAAHGHMGRSLRE
jgi:hypothetical protein